MPHDFQKAAVVALLCSPSTLHKVFTDPKVDFEAKLDSLGLSTEALAEIKAGMKKLKGDSAKFTDLGARTKAEIWDGAEPHPDDNKTKLLVAAARKLDSE